ncbi:MAG: biopolymer transporter ExbB [Maritimibacter sp.]
MDQPETQPQSGASPEAEPKFTRPLRQIVLMIVVLALVGVGLFFALPKVLPLFLANLYLNGFIAFVFFIGLLASLWQVVQIASSVSWIKRFTRGEVARDAAPRLLAPLAALLRTRAAQSQIGAASARSILESVATRIDEERDITRYITNLLIFLGLLGTFYGLATTVPAVVDTIRSLAPSENEGGVEVFGRLMTGLEAQLGGMGTAFSSSLLGLAGSLVVGLLELFSSHGQNRFYRELEEWLSSITKLGFASGDGDGSEQSAMAYVVHLSEQIDALRDMVAQSEATRSAVDTRLWQLGDGIERLASRVSESVDTDEVLATVAHQQERLADLLEAQAAGGDTDQVDAESRMRLRSIDVQLLRILEEMAAGRQETTADLRTDIKALTRAIERLGGGS